MSEALVDVPVGEEDTSTRSGKMWAEIQKEIDLETAYSAKSRAWIEDLWKQLEKPGSPDELCDLLEEL